MDSCQTFSLSVGTHSVHRLYFFSFFPLEWVPLINYCRCSFGSDKHGIIIDVGRKRWHWSLSRDPDFVYNNPVCVWWGACVMCVTSGCGVVWCGVMWCGVVCGGGVCGVCVCVVRGGLVYWGLTPQQQPGSYQKAVKWWWWNQFLVRGVCNDVW